MNVVTIMELKNESFKLLEPLALLNYTRDTPEFRNNHYVAEQQRTVHDPNMYLYTLLIAPPLMLLDFELMITIKVVRATNSGILFFLRILMCMIYESCDYNCCPFKFNIYFTVVLYDWERDPELREILD